MCNKVETDNEPKIEIYIDPGDASVEEIRDALIALSDLHIACGGNGLLFHEELER
jgi:hypothetical protein